MEIRDRIKELRRVKASELLPNPKNWRTHPIAQRTALSGLLQEVGYANALLVRETPDGLMLVDGHLRAEESHDNEVPVLVLDISEEESDLILATLDPVASMAGRDEQQMSKLLADVNAPRQSSFLGFIANDSVSDFLDTLANEYESETNQADEWEQHWQGMPEYDQEDLSAYRTISIHFRNENDVNIFADLVDQKITQRTKSIWYPAFDRDAETRVDRGSVYVDSAEGTATPD